MKTKLNFCCSQKNFIKGVIFHKLELIISMKSTFNPLSTWWLFIFSSICIVFFSSSCLHFNLFCSIRNLISLRLILEKRDLDLAGKKYLFVYDDSICFLLNHILSWIIFNHIIKSYFNWHWLCKEFWINKKLLLNGAITTFSFFSESVQVNFDIGDVLWMFHCILFFLCQYKSPVTVIGMPLL